MDISRLSITYHRVLRKFFDQISRKKACPGKYTFPDEKKEKPAYAREKVSCPYLCGNFGNNDAHRLPLGHRGRCSVPSSSSRPSHDGGSSDDNDNDSSSAPSSPSTPDKNEKVSVVNGKLIVKSGVSELKAEDIEDIKDQIKTVELTNIDVSPITFANCDKLETVTLDGVTINGNSTFAGCGNLRTVNLNNVDIENATSTFYLCRELTTVNGANTLETIPQSMFSGCTSLQYIDISGATSIGDSEFVGCNSLKNIRVGTELTSIEGSSAFKAIASDGTLVPMELTVHCMGSAEDVENLEGLFGAYGVGNYASGYPQYKYDCNDNCWNQIVSQSQTVVPDTGNALARYLLDLRL